jgi:hypothetical protein
MYMKAIKAILESIMLEFRPDHTRKFFSKGRQSMDTYYGHENMNHIPWLVVHQLMHSCFFLEGFPVGHQHDNRSRLYCYTICSLL